MVLETTTANLHQHPTLRRLDEQIQWYDSKSTANQRWFKRLKVTVILAGALTPLAAGLSMPVWIPGTLGVIVVLVEAIQQLNQHQQLWVTYRATAEALKHEKYLYLGHAYPYSGDGDLLPRRPAQRRARTQVAIRQPGSEGIGGRVVILHLAA